MADVLIRGLEMPDGCHNCRFSYFDKGETNDGEPCTVLMCSAMNQGTNGAEYDGNRPFWCPLVPLPEGHGRLGDLDKLEDAFIRYYLEQERNNNLVFAAVEIKQRAADMIGDWPTIVPAEGGTENDP